MVCTFIRLEKATVVWGVGTHYFCLIILDFSEDAIPIIQEHFMILDLASYDF